MPKAIYVTAFEETVEPITQIVTKFGGQPVWLEKPCWPLSPKTQEAIPFLCQIRLEPEIFGKIEAKMAYLFYQPYQPDSDSYDFEAVAAVLQPGSYSGLSSNQVSGPTTMRTVSLLESPFIERHPIECSVQLELSDDFEFEANSRFNNDFPEKVKIGGTPQFWNEGSLFPENCPDEWNLLLQCRFSECGENESLIPFDLGFGNEGSTWWFLSKDGLKTEFNFIFH